ncbi:AI-2E family transporter [Candidatus Latescibacterota bacterium]
MAERSGLSPGGRALLFAAATVIVIQGINQAQSVLVSFLVAVFLSMLATPPVLWLERMHLPAVAAVPLVMAGMVTVLATLGAMVGGSMNDFYGALPAYQDRLQQQVVEFQSLLAARGIVAMDKVLLDFIDPGVVMKLTARLLGAVGSALSNIVLITLAIAFILFEASSFPVKLRAVLGDPRHVFPKFTKFVGDMERYVIIRTITSLATGLLIGTWLSVLGVDFPVLWGFLAFLLNYVPSVGSMIAATPAVLLALIQLGVGSAAAAAAGFAVANLVLGSVIETRLMGRKLQLSTLAVFLSLMFWGSLLGPVGMVLCIPLTLTVKFACGMDEGTRWIAVVLGRDAPVESTPKVSEVADGS